MTTEIVLLSSFVALESSHFYSAFNPSIFTIEAHVKTQQDVSAIRKGEVIASIASFALAGVVGLLIKSILPVILTTGVVVGMVSVYEHALTLAPIQAQQSEFGVTA